MNIWLIDRDEEGNIQLTPPISAITYQPVDSDLPWLSFTQGQFKITFPDDDQAEMVGRMLRDEVEVREWEEEELREWLERVEDD